MIIDLIPKEWRSSSKYLGKIACPGCVVVDMRKDLGLQDDQPGLEVMRGLFPILVPFRKDVCATSGFYIAILLCASGMSASLFASQTPFP